MPRFFVVEHGCLGYCLGQCLDLPWVEEEEADYGTGELAEEFEEIFGFLQQRTRGTLIISPTILRRRSSGPVTGNTCDMEWNRSWGRRSWDDEQWRQRALLAEELEHHCERHRKQRELSVPVVQ